VPAGASYVGSFDREEAVADESMDFFASGHPLVEGLLVHLDDSPAGRVGLLEMDGGQPGQGVVVLYKEGTTYDIVAVDTSGRKRPQWAETIRRHPSALRPVSPQDAGHIDWRRLVAVLGPRTASARRPYAVAAIVVQKAGWTRAKIGA
jgi:ATP-dependent helicase HepA